MGRKRRFGWWFLLVLVGGPLLGPRVAAASMIGRAAPELTNTVWINSSPVRLADLRGRVILLEFWTYG
ncbi:MAG: hypothetical protein ACE5IQ_03455 [Candidatus Methylomirabilales bacterium]